MQEYLQPNAPPCLADISPGADCPLIAANTPFKDGLIRRPRGSRIFKPVHRPLPQPDEALADAAARLEAVARLHALPFQTQNGGRRTVVLDDYLYALADHFVDDTAGHSRMVLLVNADPIRVSVRVAGMLGQIVNELVTAVRHALDPKRPGVIQVECGVDAGGTLVLQVSDVRMRYIVGSVRVGLGYSVRRS